MPLMAERVPTVDDYIRAAMAAFRAERGEKMIHAGGRPMKVRTAGERTILLPNGQKVKVTTDDSGCATQIEENEALHGIARPKTIRRKLSVVKPHEVYAAIHGTATPNGINASAHMERPSS